MFQDYYFEKITLIFIFSQQNSPFSRWLWRVHYQEISTLSVHFFQYLNHISSTMRRFQKANNWKQSPSKHSMSEKPKPQPPALTINTRILGKNPTLSLVDEVFFFSILFCYYSSLSCYLCAVGRHQLCHSQRTEIQSSHFDLSPMERQ